MSRFGMPFSSDLRVSLRSLRQAKGFTLTAVLLLALGIALNVTVFGVANLALFQARPGVQDPRTLAIIGRAENGRGFDNMSWAAYDELRKHTRSFVHLAAHDVRPYSLSIGNNTVRLMGGSVSPNYFAALGVSASLGRLFKPDFGWQPSEDRSIVISYQYWQNHLGADASIIGRDVRLNGQPFRIIGVAEKDFRSHELVRTADLWVPTPAAQAGALTDNFYTRFDYSAVTLIGRLQPGVSLSAARQELNNIFDSLQQRYPRELARQSVAVAAYTPLSNEEIEDVAAKVFAVFSILTGLVLLTVCANLAGLVLARSVARQRDVAIRLSLGAHRSDVLRQMLVEGTLLVLPAAALGLLLSQWVGDTYLQALDIDAFTLHLSLRPDAATFAYLAVVLTFAVLSFTLLPAWQTTRIDLERTLRSGGATTGPARTWMREGLVFAQVFLSVILLVGAGLLGQTILNLARIDLRMKPDHLLSLAVDPAASGFSPEKQQIFHRQLREAALALPGVLEVSSVAMPPLSGGSMGMGPISGGRVEKARGIHSDMNIVGPRFFETLGLPILRGRSLSEQDSAKAPLVTVINETMARRLFGDEDPIGRQLILEEEQRDRVFTVVGLVQDSVFRDLTEAPRTMYYLSNQQQHIGLQHLLLRTQGDPLQFVEPVKRAVAKLDPNLPVFAIKTMEMRVAEAARPWQILAGVAIGSGLLAGAIAAVGLIGLIAWTIARRTREFGLKMALGASPQRILADTLLQGLRAPALALLAGLATAFLLSNQLREYLYRVNPRDPGIYLGIAAFVTLTFSLAAWLPARRTTRISPAEALHYE